MLEMLLVVAIIAILVAISIPMVGDRLERVRVAADSANERGAWGCAVAQYLVDGTFAGQPVAALSEAAYTLARTMVDAPVRLANRSGGLPDALKIVTLSAGGGDNKVASPDAGIMAYAEYPKAAEAESTSIFGISAEDDQKKLEQLTNKAKAVNVFLCCEQNMAPGSKTHYGNAKALGQARFDGYWKLGDPVPCTWNVQKPDKTWTQYEWFCPLILDTDKWTSFYNNAYKGTTHRFRKCMYGTGLNNIANFFETDPKTGLPRVERLGFYWDKNKASDPAMGQWVSYFNKKPDDPSDPKGLFIVMTELPPEATPNAKIGYVDEKLTGLEANISYKITVGTGGETTTVTADGEGKIAIPEEWMGETLSIVKPAQDAATRLDSKAQVLSISARREAPTVGKADTSSAGARDGKITGVSADMEYKKTDENSWTQCTGTEVTGLPAGSYEVRVKAKDTVGDTEGNFYGLATSVTVGSREPEPPGQPTPDPEPPDPPTPDPTPPGPPKPDPEPPDPSTPDPTPSGPLKAWYNGESGRWQTSWVGIRPYGKCKDHPDGILCGIIENGVLSLVWTDQRGNVLAGEGACHVERSTQLW